MLYITITIHSKIEECTFCFDTHKTYRMTICWATEQVLPISSDYNHKVSVR